MLAHGHEPGRFMNFVFFEGHLRVLAVATISLVVLAAAHSTAAPAQGIPGETRLTAPPELQQAQVRAAASASMRVAVGF